MTSLTQYVADAMRHVNEVEKKSLTYDDFWRDLAIAAIDAVESYNKNSMEANCSGVYHANMLAEHSRNKESGNG